MEVVHVTKKGMLPADGGLGDRGYGCAGAAVGSALPGAADRRTAAGTARRAGTTSWASALP